MREFGFSVDAVAQHAVDSLAARFPRIGLDGLLAGRAGRARRGRWVRVPARAAAEGFRWRRRDGRDRVWWPQGIDVRMEPGRRILAVSWYAHPHGAAPGGCRVTFVELRGRRAPRYRHVVLVESAPDAADAGMRPVLAHAGGIAWEGDRLVVAATFGGLRVFDVRDILRTTRRRPFWIGRRGIGPFGATAVLPQREHWVPAGADRATRPRYSFVSLEHGSPPGLVAGEYLRDEPVGRLLRVGMPGEGAPTVDEVHVPGLTRMQGATVVDGTWVVTTSEGTRVPGDLWVGPPDALVRHRGVLAPGPEDIAREAGGRSLWTLSEQPGRRWVYRIDADRWLPAAGSHDRTHRGDATQRGGDEPARNGGHREHQGELRDR